MYVDNRTRNVQRVKNVNGCFDSGSIEGFTAGVCDCCGRWDSELQKVHETHVCRHSDCVTMRTNVAMAYDTTNPKMWDVVLKTVQAILTTI